MTWSCNPTSPVLLPVRTIGPAEPPVSIDRFKDHGSIDGSDKEVLIREYLDAATEFFDGPGGCLGLVLMPQTWRQDYAAFANPLLLPLRPVQSVASITYYDADDASQTLSTDVYSLVASHVDGPRVVLKAGQSWPTISTRDDAVSVTFVAGHATGQVPHRVLQAIRLIVADWFRMRENSQDVNLAEIPYGCRELIANVRRAVM